MAHFPNFWGNESFYTKNRLSCTTSKGFLEPCQNSEKSNDPVPRKHPEMAGGKNGQILFHRILSASARGLTSTTAVGWP